MRMQLAIAISTALALSALSGCAAAPRAGGGALCQGMVIHVVDGDTVRCG